MVVESLDDPRGILRRRAVLNRRGLPFRLVRQPKTGRVPGRGVPHDPPENVGELIVVQSDAGASLGSDARAARRRRVVAPSVAAHDDVIRLGGVPVILPRRASYRVRRERRRRALPPRRVLVPVLVAQELLAGVLLPHQLAKTREPTVHGASRVFFIPPVTRFERLELLVRRPGQDEQVRQRLHRLPELPARPLRRPRPSRSKAAVGHGLEQVVEPGVPRRERHQRSPERHRGDQRALQEDVHPATQRAHLQRDREHGGVVARGGELQAPQLRLQRGPRRGIPPERSRGRVAQSAPPAHGRRGHARTPEPLLRRDGRGDVVHPGRGSQRVDGPEAVPVAVGEFGAPQLRPRRFLVLPAHLAHLELRGWRIEGVDVVLHRGSVDAGGDLCRVGQSRARPVVRVVPFAPSLEVRLVLPRGWRAGRRDGGRARGTTREEERREERRDRRRPSGHRRRPDFPSLGARRLSCLCLEIFTPGAL